MSDDLIHLDPETDILFAVLWRRADHGIVNLSEHRILRRWWAYIRAIIDTHPNGELVATPLHTLFYMA